MDPGNHALSYRLVCPARYITDTNPRIATFDGETYLIINNSFIISEAEDKNSNNNHLMLPRESDEGEVSSLRCCFCWKVIISKSYYLCSQCNQSCHKECVESPPVIKSSDHPNHPLLLVWLISVKVIDSRSACRSCGWRTGSAYYFCFICGFQIHTNCARYPAPQIIRNQKRHKHTLLYLPRRSSMSCDVCGKNDSRNYLYVCLICDFVVHQLCINYPYVIKVSRHNHRLVFTPHLPYKMWSDCGVCHEKISGNYGKYSCQKGCSYAIHSGCAMRTDVSDGRELEGEPEEAYENMSMFVKEGDGIIRHVSHPHHQMQLQRVYDETKQCQVCMLPFYEDGDVYHCMQCDDFVFHEVCAFVSRVKQFMLHVHSLTLMFEHTATGFKCRKCGRYSCGFRYVCCFPMCKYWELDTRCASIDEPFDHHLHPHQLFITSTITKLTSCSICGTETRQPLDCALCKFFLCFRSATLPKKVSYEHDEHLLILSDKSDVKFEVYWCEICEEDMFIESWLYTCEECKTTLHIACLLGRDPYVKPGTSIKIFEETILSLSNMHSSRPICKICKRRCPYKLKMELSSKDIFCSTICCEIYYVQKK